MRLIKVYKDWTSAGALVNAVLSEEELAAIHYGPHEAGSHSQIAPIESAVAKAKQMFWASTVKKLNNIFWAGFLIAFVLLPIAKIPKDIQTFFLILFGTVFAISISGLIQTCVMRHKFGKFDFDSLKHVQGPDLAPPVTAYRDKEVKAPTLRHSAMFFVIFVFLNCFAMASPAYPAKIGNVYKVKSSFVAPWVGWETTTKIQQGSMIAIVVAPETDQIHVARARYVVQRIAFAEDESEWLDWTQSRFSYLVSNITQALYQQAPEMPQSEWTQWILDTWETDWDGEMPLDVLRNAMIAHFQARYDGVYELLSLEINIEHIPYSKYRKEVQK